MRHIAPCRDHSGSPTNLRFLRAGTTVDSSEAVKIMSVAVGDSKSVIPATSLLSMEPEMIRPTPAACRQPKLYIGAMLALLLGLSQGAFAQGLVKGMQDGAEDGARVTYVN